MKLTLHIWRQAGPKAQGRMVSYPVADASPDMSFLELLDVLNEQLIAKGEEPVAFDHDCREGICGSCAMMINGQAHGPERGATTCQLHLRSFADGDEVFVEPWRAAAFPVVKDLVCDRSSLDRACVAACPNASAMLFVAAKVGHLSSLPQGRTEKTERVKSLVAAHDREGFGHCTNIAECEAACPKEISMEFITQLNRDYIQSALSSVVKG
jgi:succinate dehydrogenase / fumarate reductase iron-sulfur subunit